MGEAMQLALQFSFERLNSSGGGCLYAQFGLIKLLQKTRFQQEGIAAPISAH